VVGVEEKETEVVVVQFADFGNTVHGECEEEDWARRCLKLRVYCQLQVNKWARRRRAWQRSCSRQTTW
jgi:hypothetical protein